MAGTPVLLNKCFHVRLYDGGELSPRHAVENILDPCGLKYHSSQKPRNLTLLLESATPVALTHVAIVSSELCDNPLKGLPFRSQFFECCPAALFWVSDIPSDPASTSSFDAPSPASSSSWPTVREHLLTAVAGKAPNAPCAFVETTPEGGEGYTSIVKPYPIGRYVLVKMLCGWIPEIQHIDVSKLYLIGFAGATAPALAAVCFVVPAGALIVLSGLSSNPRTPGRAASCTPSSASIC